jgi:hypothetical protein
VAWPWSALIVIGLGLAVATLAVAALMVVVRVLHGSERPVRRQDWNPRLSSNGHVQEHHTLKSPDHGRGP